MNKTSAAIAALEDTAYVEESARLNREGLAQLMSGLDALGVRYVPSHGNFLLVHVGDALQLSLDGLEVNRLHQLVVTETLQTTRDPDIFAIGDCPP